MKMNKYLYDNERSELINDYVKRKYEDDLKIMIRNIEVDYDNETFHESYIRIVESILNELFSEEITVRLKFGKLIGVDENGIETELHSFINSKNGEQIINGDDGMYEVPTEQFIIERINSQVYKMITDIKRI